jgi:hypothetical protein
VVGIIISKKFVYMTIPVKFNETNPLGGRGWEMGDPRNMGGLLEAPRKGFNESIINPVNPYSKTFNTPAVINYFTNALKHGRPSVLQNVENFLMGGNIKLNDDTGQVSFAPQGRFNIKSNDGWNLSLDALTKSASFGKGAFNVAGSFGKEPYVRAGFQVPFSQTNEVVNPSGPVEGQMDKQLKHFNDNRVAVPVPINVENSEKMKKSGYLEEDNDFLKDYIRNKLY